MGARFEHRLIRWVRERYGKESAIRHPNWDGDVTLTLGGRVYRVECKQRTGMKLRSMAELRDWLDQVLRYEKQTTIPFILVFTGGNEYQRGRMWVVQPLDQWIERETRGST